MNRYYRTSLITAGLILLTASLLFAATADDLGPKTIELKMGKKTVLLNHRQHQQLTKNQCWECHDKKIGKIENWNESKAHKICIPCHDLNEKGPVMCKGCHKK